MVSSINCDRFRHLDLAVSSLPGRWLAYYTAPVRAKPDSRPCLEGACYRNNQQAAHSYLTRLSRTSLTHIAHTYQFPSSPWTSTLDCYMVSALGSRVGWTPARKEWTNERPFAGVLSWYATSHSASYHQLGGKSALAVICNWEGNSKSGITPAIHHRLYGIFTYGLTEEDEQLAYAPVWRMWSFYMVAKCCCSSDHLRPCWWIEYIS